MPVHILGVSAFFHDSAAAIVRDGELVAAAQEERFTRTKHDPDFPHEAVRYCLRESGIDAADLDEIVFYEHPHRKFDRLVETFLRYAPRGFAAFRRALPEWASTKLHLPGLIAESLGDGFAGRIEFVDHHESHAASAFFPSPFEEAAILTIDAVGEWPTTSLGIGRGNRLELLRELHFPHSIGMLYSAFTYYTGFRVNSGEYKVMGLAPYGRPIYTDLILDRVVDLAPDGSLWLDMSYFDFGHGLRMTSEKFHALFGGPPRTPESQITQKEMDLAASVQAVCEEAVLRLGRHAHRATGQRHLVMAGGVALNCVANGRLSREGPFEDIWVQPAAGDAGGAAGAALLAWHHGRDAPRRVRPSDSQAGSLLGPAFDVSDITIYLDGEGAIYERVPDEDELLDRVAELLEEEKTIGWFQGRMEYGPRALGARSIIGDARSTRMQRTMNLKIKFRESFRPFAPCVLREHAAEWFDVESGCDSPYMLFVAPVRDDVRLAVDEEDRRRMEHPDLRVRVSVPRSAVPAVTHVDYSARLQTVDAERHGRFYRLMRRFHERTGCPVLVNTSFNVRGEPIVCTPADAFRCFMATNMDALVLEDVLLLKEWQNEDASVDREAFLSQFALD